MKHTDRTKKLISDRFKNKPKSSEHVAKVAAAMIGKRRPDLAERNKARVGTIVSIEARANISKAQKGRKHSAETKAKISASNKGKPKSLEHKLKISETLRNASIKL